MDRAGRAMILLAKRFGDGGRRDTRGEAARQRVSNSGNRGYYAGSAGRRFPTADGSNLVNRYRSSILR